MRSFLVKKSVDPYVMDEYHAYKNKSGGTKRNGVIIPQSSWNGFTKEFHQVWTKLTDAQQHQITSLSEKSTKNSELSVYQDESDSNVYFAQHQYYLDDYSAFQASSYEYNSSLALSDASDGEDAADFDINNLEIADDEEQLIAQKASAKPVSILKSHKANGRRGRTLSKKSNLPV